MINLCYFIFALKLKILLDDEFKGSIGTLYDL